MPDFSDKARAAFHQELLAKTIEIRKKQADYREEDLNPEQIGYIHANAILKVAHITDPAKKQAAKVEALRILSMMLGKSPTLAQKFTSAGFEVVIVPADTPFTSLPEFRASPSLVNQVTGVAVSISENTSGPARTWAETRGMGGIEIGGKIYVAVTEENLVGGATSGAALAAHGACYAAQYSTTAHEFAHTIHLHAMDARQKQVIVDCYKRRLKGIVVGSDGTVKCGTADVDSNLTGKVNPGPIATTYQIKSALEVEWVDGPRLHAAPWPQEYDIRFKNALGAAVMQGTAERSFKSRFAPVTNYASSNAREYWAQLVSAYLGCNGGTDPYTGRARHNSRVWIMNNEEPAICNLLDEIFSPHGLKPGIGSGFGAATTPDTNLAAPAPPVRKTIREIIDDAVRARGGVPGKVKSLKRFWENIGH